MPVANTDVQFAFKAMAGSTALATGPGGLVAVLDSLISGFGSVTMSSLSVNSNGIATAVFSSEHGFYMYGAAGPVVTISGVNDSSGYSIASLNGNFRIASVATDNKSFTFNTSTSSIATTYGNRTAKIAGFPLIKTGVNGYKSVYKFLTDDGVGDTVQHFLRVDDSVTATAYATLNMYDDVPDVDTGTGTNPSANHYVFKAATNWFAFADPYMLFFLHINGALIQGFMFGYPLELTSTDVYNCLLCGASGNTSVMTGLDALNAYTNISISRNYTQLGTSIKGGYRPGMTAVYTIFQGGPITKPNPCGNTNLFANLLLFQDANTIRALIPGLLFPYHFSTGFTNLETTVTKEGKTIIAVYNNARAFCFDITGPWR